MEDILMVQQPESFKINLFPHQLASIYSMEQLETQVRQTVKDTPSQTVSYTTQIGVLADIPGYGKTASIIGLLVRDNMEWDNQLPYIRTTIVSQANGRRTTTTINKYDKLNCNLVLVSPNILHQWVAELNKTQLRYLAISKKAQLVDLDPSKYDVIVVIPSVYNLTVLNSQNLAWKRFIFDEPSNMRVLHMASIQAGFVWFITATPHNITGKHNNCKSTFMSEIGFFEWCESVIVQNKPEFIEQSFKMPTTTYINHKCYLPVYNSIFGMVNPSILNLIETGNIEGAIISLGGKKTDNLIELVKMKKQDELAILTSEICIANIRQNRDRITELQDRVIIVEKELDEISTRFAGRLKEQCNICWEPLKFPTMESNCQNIFCGECILTWMKTNSTCPLCRANITSSDLTCISPLSYYESIRIPIEKLLTKNQTILQIISNKPEGKFILFSDNDFTFGPLADLLKQNNITHTQLKGLPTTIVKNINKFKQGTVSVLFLNSNYNGAGINIQEATDVILYHDMEITTTAQVIGRANRIGRLIPLTVHRLLIA